MNTHDIELPPLPDWFVGYSEADKYAVQVYARAAIEPYAKRIAELEEKIEADRRIEGEEK